MMFKWILLGLVFISQLESPVNFPTITMCGYSYDMSIIITDPSFDPANFNPDGFESNTPSLDNYNGVIKNSPFEANFSIDPSTGKITSVASISRYNKVKIGTYQFPGSSTISVSREKKVSIEKGKQGAGNKVVDTGIDLARVSITTDLFNDNDLEDFQDIINFFEGRKGLKASSDGFSIINPTTTARGVLSVYLEGIEGPDYNNGRTTYKTKWVEVVKVKKTQTKNIGTAKQNDDDPIYETAKTNKATPPSKDKRNTQPAGSQKTKRTAG